MNLSISIRRFLHLPRPLARLLVACFITILFINLFVGVLVYQNPLLSLIDVRNMISVLIAEASVAVGLFAIHRAVLFLENFWRQKQLTKKELLQ